MSRCGTYPPPQQCDSRTHARRQAAVRDATPGSQEASEGGLVRRSRQLEEVGRTRGDADSIAMADGGSGEGPHGSQLTDASVARHRHLQPSTQRSAGDGGDGGLGARLQRRRQRSVQVLEVHAGRLDLRRPPQSSLVPAGQHSKEARTSKPMRG